MLLPAIKNKDIKNDNDTHEEIEKCQEDLNKFEEAKIEESRTKQEDNELHTL